MSSSHISMRHAAALVPLCLATALLLSGCWPPGQHANFNNVYSSRPTAQQVLAALRTSFRSVVSFHVVMRVQHAGNANGSSFQIRNADGDIVLPDKIKAQASVILSGQPVTVNLISIGDTQFITDPVTGQWRVFKGTIDPRSLTNPDTGIIAAVSKLQSVSGPTDDTINGVPCWRITGSLDASTLAFITGGGVPAHTMLQTSECIGKADSLLYQLNVTGQAAAGYTSQSTFTFLLSNYNEHVTIVAPQTL
jgi:hypothetical protein